MPLLAKETLMEASVGWTLFGLAVAVIFVGWRVYKKRSAGSPSGGSGGSQPPKGSGPIRPD